MNSKDENKDEEKMQVSLSSDSDSENANDDNELKKEEVEKKEEEEDDDNDDDDDDDDEDILLEKRSAELELQISENVYAYDAYIELIDCYRKLVNLDKLRSTYVKFSQHFPLTGSLWISWIQDEIRIASTEQEYANIEKLFEKAVKDYLSVELWLEYVQFNMNKKSAEDSRKLFEKALNAAGLHVAKGSLVWDAYREFELAHLACISNIESDEWKMQAMRVAQLFRRQLSVPLLDMERTFVEWRVWVERLPDKNVVDYKQTERDYKSAVKLLQNTYESYEEQLLQVNSNDDNDKMARLHVYRKYIEEAAATNYPEHVRCLYERALAHHCLDVDLWLDYCDYYRRLANFEAMVSVCERAVRNCPWNEQLWIVQMRALEASGRPHADITDCLERALAVGFNTNYQCQQLWLCYLDHYRRITNPTDTSAVIKLRDAFYTCQNHLVEQFGVESSDPECRVLRLWAHVEAITLADMPAARKLWNEGGLLSTHGDSATLWLELAALEQRLGDDKHVRRVFQRALQQVRDWPMSIMDAWISYERQCGSIDTILACEATCRQYIRTHNLQDTQLESQSQQLQLHSNNTSSSINKQKRKRSSTEPKQTAKHVKISPTSPSSPPPPPPPSSSSSSTNNQKESPDPIDDETEERTIFVSNLDYNVTKEQLEEFLGSVESVRIVKDSKGHSKGYAYCFFKDKESAKQVLNRDREFLAGRPVFISKCKVDRMQRQVPFKYATSREKHKLFVRGLPLTITQQQLEELFGKHGELKEVRLVTYRNGRPKGLAYIEYMDEKSSAKAIMATDNTTLDGHVISVAISYPPKRKQPAPVSQPAPIQPKSRMHLPLIPRPLVNVTTTTTTTTNTPSSSSSSQPSMNNQDFRKMFNLK